MSKPARDQQRPVDDGLVGNRRRRHILVYSAAVGVVLLFVAVAQLVRG